MIVAGAEEIARTLRDYRDGIQWIRDSVVRGANAGQSLDELVRTIRLPAHLARSGYLTELYGQLDWSVRALYTNRLGWFDERVETLYPLERREEARRTVALMGGAGAIVTEIEGSLEREDPRWALHLLALLRDSGEPLELRRPLWRRALTDTAKTVANTNGRGYLLEEAWRLEHGVARMGQPTVPDALVDALPLAMVFEVLQTRLIPELADVEESVTFRFPGSQTGPGEDEGEGSGAGGGSGAGAGAGGVAASWGLAGGRSGALPAAARASATTRCKPTKSLSACPTWLSFHRYQSTTGTASRRSARMVSETSAAC
ncbi:MAG: alkyl sulfatase dimerization domain-containing protein [Deltaproteobacteria bacterium]|nr:alkyl sulfatase dimerization domain-containing protein [Deltaproteobacteria bacterium]